MGEDHFNWPSTWNRRRPVQSICGNDVDEVYGPLNLFVNLRQQRGTQSFQAHSAFKCHTAISGPAGPQASRPVNSHFGSYLVPPGWSNDARADSSGGLTATRRLASDSQ